MTFDTGGMFGGPGGDIEDAMRAAHLDLSGIFGSESPKTHFRDGLPILVEAQYRIREPWSVGVLLGRSLIGTTHGNGPGFMSIRANYAVTSVAAMLSAGPRSIQIGLGPALHLARSRSGALGGGQSPPWSDHWKVGFIAQARAMVPESSRIFLDLTLKYSLVGGVVVGPYSATGIGDQMVTFPATSVEYNHWFIGAGPGLRF